MPELSRFHGIVIGMYYNDHPPPHFHVRYGEARVVVDLLTLRVAKGRLPRRVERMVLTWADEHRDELWAAWELARRAEPLTQIDPPAE